MKKLIYIFALFFVFACDSEDTNDCIQRAGEILRQEVVVNGFDKILVNRDIELIIEQGENHSVIVESGKNIINDIEAVVANGKLELTNNNTCNWVREYGLTKVYVTSPDITEIRTSTQYDISSNGILTYDSLRLLSEDFNVPDTFTVGDFRLQVNIQDLRITANNISSFYISGQVENLNVGFFDGTGRFEGRDLIAQHLTISHRGSNDMVVNPQQSLTGVLRGTGDLIAVNEPPMVDIEQLYTGRLIFE